MYPIKISGSISLKCSKNLANNSPSVLQGTISLFLALVRFNSFLSSRTKITHLSGVLSQYAMVVIGIGALSIYSSVKAPPISHSISKNNSLWPIEGWSSIPYFSIKNFWYGAISWKWRLGVFLSHL